MSDSSDPSAGLLPAGLRDVLPPRAELEAATSERLMTGFTAWGYRRVKPPLAEFEETLLAGPGQALAGSTFRFMDPASQRMLTLRSDITVQVARIATTRLRDEPRPLRLSYAGQVLRTRGSQLRPERQFAQAGFELIGSQSPAADLEVALLAVQAALDLGIGALSLDLTDPLVVPAVAAGLGLTPAATEAVRRALDHKDAAALKVAAPDPAAHHLLAAFLVTGPAGDVLRRLGDLALPGPARDRIAAVAALVAGVAAELPDLLVTLDLGESRGLEYHTGISFSLFARNVRGELGRGGRYLAGDAPGEPAVGCTLYLDSIMRALPAGAPERLLLVGPLPRAQALALQQQGWRLLHALDTPVTAGEARRLHCTHWLTAGGPQPV